MKQLLRTLGFQEFTALDREAFPEAEQFLNGDGPYIRPYPGGAIVIDKTGILAESWTKDGMPYENSKITNLYAARAWLLSMSRIRHWQPAFAWVAGWPGAEAGCAECGLPKSAHDGINTKAEFVSPMI